MCVCELRPKLALQIDTLVVHMPQSCDLCVHTVVQWVSTGGDVMVGQ